MGTSEKRFGCVGGIKPQQPFERLLSGWREQGYELVALRDLVASTDPGKLPLHSVVDAALPGRSGTLATQGPAFLAEDSSRTLGRPVPVNPTVHDARAGGYISNSVANAWADVFNHRYRWLLAILAHALRPKACRRRQPR